jgi:hypothetical protein
VSWFKLSDGSAFHRKVLKAGNEAFGAWARAGAWSSAPDNLTDGYIPPEVCANIAPARVWSRLRDAGLTEAPSEGRPGEQIHDFLGYNPSAEAVKRERDATRRRVDSWRNKRRMDEDGNGTCNVVTNVVSTTAPSRPVPSRPSDPDPPVAPPEGGLNQSGALLDVGPPEPRPRPRRAQKPRAGMSHRPEAWRPNDGHYALGGELGLGRAEVDAEVGGWTDHHLAAGTMIADFDGSFRTWIRNAPKFRGRGGHPAKPNVQPVPPGGRLWKSLPEV